MSALVVLRVLQQIISVIDRIMFSTVGYSLFSGWKKEYLRAKSSYESSAHVFKIGFRAKTRETELAKLDNFLLFHSRYVHPNSVMSGNVTLFGVSEDIAYFAVLPTDVDVYSSELHPFMYVTQFRFASHIIAMPITSFHLLSEEIGDPKAQVVLLSNTGRCGSTLLAQMFENIPKTIVMSEPDAFTSAADVRNEGKTSKEQDDKILRSIMRLQCKNIQGIDRIIIKTRAECAYQIKRISHNCNFVKHIFMYRHPKNNIRSFINVFQTVSTNFPFPHESLMPLPETDGFQMIKKSCLFKGLTIYGAFTLMWVIPCICYLAYQHEGIEIHPVRYEELLKDPHSIVSKLFSYLGIPKECVPQALAVMQKDSQKGSDMGRDKLGKHKMGEFTVEQLAEINFVLQRAGFSSIEEFNDLPDWNEVAHPSQLTKNYTSV